jgi:hypothetical protein
VGLSLRQRVETHGPALVFFYRVDIKTLRARHPTIARGVSRGTRWLRPARSEPGAYGTTPADAPATGPGRPGGASVIVNLALALVNCMDRGTTVLAVKMAVVVDHALGRSKFPVLHLNVRLGFRWPASPGSDTPRL